LLIHFSVKSVILGVMSVVVVLVEGSWRLCFKYFWALPEL